MKTSKVTIFTFLAMFVGFTSCKKDNNDSPQPDQLTVEGTWKMSSIVLEAVKNGKVVYSATAKAGTDFYQKYLQFTADGKFSSTDADNLPREIIGGSYTLVNDQLTIVSKDDEGEDTDLFKVTRSGNTIELRIDDFIDEDSFLSSPGDDEEIDADQLNIVVKLEKTEEDPSKAVHVIIGTWTVNEAKIEGLLDGEVKGSETLTVADGLEASVYAFQSDGSLTVTTTYEDETEVEKGTYSIEDGIVTLILEDDDERNYPEFAIVGNKLTLAIYDTIDSDFSELLDGDYDSYNIIISLNRTLL